MKHKFIGLAKKVHRIEMPILYLSITPSLHWLTKRKISKTQEIATPVRALARNDILIVQKLATSEDFS